MTGAEKTKNIVFKVLMYIVLIFTILISVAPIVWVIISSFKTNSEILSSPFALPSSIDFDAYKYLFENYNFIKYFLNSLLISIVSTFVSLFIYALAGFVLGKFNFPGKKVLFVLFTITLLVPNQAKAQPYFSLIGKLNLYDNIWGLALIYLSFGLATSIFILRASFMSIPKSLDEAATLDGASFWSIFWNINLPLAKNGLATAGTLMFLNNWNEFFYASLLTSADANRTLPVALSFFTESFSYNYTLLFAALTLVIAPAVILYIFAQNQVQQSIAGAGIKG